MKTLLKITAPVVLIVLFFIIAELSLRFFGYGYHPSLIIPRQTADGTRATLNPGALLSYTGLSVVNSSREPFLNLPLDKPDNNIRVLLLGGSAAYGAYQVPDLGLARYLEAMLEEKFPDHTVDVVNLAFPSLNSSAMTRILKEGLILRPDFVVYYGAANDLGRGVIMQLSGLPPRAVFVLEEMIYTVKRLKLYQLAVNVAGRYIRKIQGFFIKKEYDSFQSLRDLSPPVTEALADAFRHNLLKITSLCRDNGIPVFLCAYAHNMKNPCTADPLGGRTGLSDIMRQAPLLEQAYAREKAGDYQAAINLYEKFQRRLPRFAAPLAHQAFCHYALGRPQKAALTYDQARRLSAGYGEKLDSFNRILRDIAAVSITDDVFAIDIPAALKKAAPKKYLADETFFTDIVHFTSEGSYQVAANISRSLAGYLEAPEPAALIPRRECDQRLGITAGRQKAIMSANSKITFAGLAAVMKRPPMGYALMHDITKKHRLQSFNDDLVREPRREEPAASPLLPVPDNPDYYYYRNLIIDLTDHGHSAVALSLAGELVEKTGRHSLALVLYGQTLLRDHQPESALAVYEEALEQPARTCDLELRLNAAEVALSLNRPGEAVGLLEPGWRMIESRRPVISFDRNLFAGFQERYRAVLERAR
ncbi:MAG: hypothetical protein ACLFS7_05765, partial [Desulfosudaceae bacterium]